MSPATTLTDRVALGIGMMLIANFLFATLDTTTKWMLTLGFPALQMAFLRYAGHFAISLGEAAWKGGRAIAVPRRYLGMVVARASLLVAATVGNFVALKVLPLTVTSAIMFSAPIILCFLAGPMLGEKVGPWRWSAILLGFVGVVVVIQPFGADFEWAALLSVFNAICMALYSILTRKLAGKVSAGTMQFFTGAVGTLTLAPLAIAVWQPSHDPAVLTLWLGLGVFGWAGHELMTRAHAFAPSSTLMPFSYSFLLYLIVFSYVVFADVPGATTLSGVAIIVAAGLVIWRREQMLMRAARAARQ